MFVGFVGDVVCGFMVGCVVGLRVVDNYAHSGLRLEPDGLWGILFCVVFKCDFID